MIPTHVVIQCGMVILCDESGTETRTMEPAGKDAIESARALADRHGFRLAGKVDRNKWRIEPETEEETRARIRILEARAEGGARITYAHRLMSARSCASIGRALRKTGSLAAEFWFGRARSIGRDAEQIRRLIAEAGR